MTNPKDTSGEVRQNAAQDAAQNAATPSADIIPFRRPVAQDAPPPPEPDTPDDDGPSAA